MSMRRVKYGWVALSLLVLIGLSQTSLAENGLTDLEGEAAQFSDYVHEDRWLVVMIWSWTCPICANEMPRYARFHDRHMDGRLAVLGISLDGPAAVMEAWGFTEEHGVTFPNLIAKGEDVARFFYQQTGQSLRGTPTFLLYAPGGELKAVQAGPVLPEGIEAFIENQENTDD
jgi:peroxiredoxin